jgi:predicted molibdopterin-dependent oxidoreductase YjgC
MTGRTLNSVIQPRDLLDVSPADAAELRLADGDPVTVESRHGEAVLAVRIAPEVRRGELFATFHTSDAFLNRVIGDRRDPHAGLQGHRGPDHEASGVTRSTPGAWVMRHATCTPRT